MLTVYGDIRSGNCYKVKLLLQFLRRPHEWVHVDIIKGESRTAAFLAKNPSGRIPLLEIEPDSYLPESDAILHLAEGTGYLPADRLEHARVLQWMFFEQNNHEPYIATSRFRIKFLKQEEAYREELSKRRAGGYAALGVMEQHLAHASYFVGARCTIADIALYAYTHVAHEGGFSLAEFPAVRGWIERIEGEPGYLAMSKGSP